MYANAYQGTDPLLDRPNIRATVDLTLALYRIQVGIATQVLERARTDLLGVIQALEDGPNTSGVAQ